MVIRLRMMSSMSSVRRNVFACSTFAKVAVLLLALFPGRMLWADTWFNARAAGSNVGIGLVWQANRSINERVHSLRLGLHGCFLTCRPNTKFDDLSELSYLTGFRRVGEFYSMSYHAGAGVVHGDRDVNCRTPNDCGGKLSIGFPLAVSLTLGKYVGFGAELFANINPVQPVVGVSVGWTLGKFN